MDGLSHVQNQATTLFFYPFISLHHHIIIISAGFWAYLFFSSYVFG